MNKQWMTVTVSVLAGVTAGGLGGMLAANPGRPRVSAVVVAPAVAETIPATLAPSTTLVVVTTVPVVTDPPAPSPTTAVPVVRRVVALVPTVPVSANSVTANSVTASTVDPSLVGQPCPTLGAITTENGLDQIILVCSGDPLAWMVKPRV